jgi:DNA-binding NarL/FixJ family response regulator
MSNPSSARHSESPAHSKSARRKTDASASRKAPSVRVLCVDDHKVLVEGLKAQFAIDNTVECVGYLPSAANLLEEVSRLTPDVVLLDIDMPGPDVFEMADRLHHMHPDARFIFLSAHVRDGYLSAAYECGASGYFAKGDELDEIVAGVKEVARSDEGVFVLGAKVRERCQPAKTTLRAGKVKSQLKHDSRPKTPLEALTPREIEILRLIGKGRSRSEIAQELSRSAKTVDGHQERIMKKLAIDSRAELMRFAIREGLAEA